MRLPLRLPALAAGFALGFVATAIATASAAGPSFDCGKVEPGSIAALVCSDDALSALDRKMSQVYAAASDKAIHEQPPVLKAEQRGWIKGRDECWKSDDKRGCVEQAYRLRIAELQARYRLVAASGSATYVCDGQPAKQVTATFFETDPPTAIAEFGDQTSLMILQPAGSGAKYQGQNEMLWEHQGEAVISWGHDSSEMRCRVKR